MAGQKVVVIGAGPVGALAALYAAQRGNIVEVYELRPDLRDPSTVPLNFTKSINLALSQRGITALQNAVPGSRLLDSILSDTIPMYGRMIHGIEDKQLFETSQKYDARGRFIRAADRHGLNKHLLDELEKYPNVKVFFSHKLTGADFKRKLAWIENRTPPTSAKLSRSPEIEISFDLLIGADGAHSAARSHLMKFARISYMQEYVDTLWCEFHISSGVSEAWSSGKDGFKLSPHHLHIWPAGSFMFIAIPSMDKTFTCTLFMSEGKFQSIDLDPQSKLVPFFEENFPGVVGALIQPADLVQQYKTNPHLPLLSIKCTPYHYGSSGVIVGDAAHAMVPFYGQGMNAGLEDVRVLFQIMDKHITPSTPPDKIEQATRAALTRYTHDRTPDAHAINDLSMRNYGEMRSDVRSPGYLIRKTVEEVLSVWFPRSNFVTQYTRVSFSDQPYAEIVRAVHRQGKILTGAASLIMGLSTATAVWFAWTRRLKQAWST